MTMINLKNSDFSNSTLNYYRGELYIACYMISRGVKPVYSLVCKEIYWNSLLRDLKKCADSYGVHYWDEYHEVEGTGYINLRLFKYTYLKDIVKYADKFKTKELPGENTAPKDFIIFREWVYGKIYGFGDAEIGKHIDNFLILYYGE